MHTAYYKEYSNNLNRYMEFKVYGHSGIPILVFPAQDGRFFDYENFKMIEATEHFIEQGLVQFFCIDSIDQETFSSMGNQTWRIVQYDNYINYVCDEVIPHIYTIQKETDINNPFIGHIITTGCSMGATHALNIFLRRPDIFKGTIAMSGIYHAGFFFNDYQDGRIYENSPLDYLPNMPKDHYYIEAYRHSDIIISVGQGRWEEECIEDTRRLQTIFNELGINNAWIDFWGYDVDHDWPWWRVQIVHFLEQLVK